MLVLLSKELVLLKAFLCVNVPVSQLPVLNCLELTLELNHFGGLHLLFGFELVDSLLDVGLAMLSLKLLTHRKSHRT